MKKKTIAIILIILLLSTALIADKSKFKAALLSLAVPGSGELYVGSKTSGYISLTAEAFLWMGYFGAKQQAEWIENDFKQYALTYSGTKITDGTEQYYDLLQDFSSSEEYNNNVYIYGRYYLNNQGWTEQEFNQFIENNLYVGNEAWDWDNEDQRLHFGQLRRDRNQFEIISGFSVGAMVINRIVSAIKAVRAAHVYNNNIEETNNISFDFNYNPISGKAKAFLTKKF